MARPSWAQMFDDGSPSSSPFSTTSSDAEDHQLIALGHPVNLLRDRLLLAMQKAEDVLSLVFGFFEERPVGPDLRIQGVYETSIEIRDSVVGQDHEIVRDWYVPAQRALSRALEATIGIAPHLNFGMNTQAGPFETDLRETLRELSSKVTGMRGFAFIPESRERWQGNVDKLGSLSRKLEAAAIDDELWHQSLKRLRDALDSLREKVRRFREVAEGSESAPNDDDVVVALSVFERSVANVPHLQFILDDQGNGCINLCDLPEWIWLCVVEIRQHAGKGSFEPSESFDATKEKIRRLRWLLMETIGGRSDGESFRSDPRVQNERVAETDRPKQTERVEARDAENLFQQNADYWDVRFRGAPEVPVHLHSPVTGLRHISTALMRQGERVLLSELAKSERSVSKPASAAHTSDHGSFHAEDRGDLGKAEEVADNEAIASYKKRLEDIKAEREKAVRNNDEAAQQRLDDESAKIGTHIAEAKRPGGKLRRIAHEQMKPVHAVRTAVSRAYEKLKKNDLGCLADHLSKHLDISTKGILYQPDPTVIWSL